MAIHPLMDKYVRKQWTVLIEAGYNATYSSALNFMLLVAIQEAIKEGGLSKTTRDVVWNFVDDESTINELNLEDHLISLEDAVTRKVNK